MGPIGHRRGSWRRHAALTAVVIGLGAIVSGVVIGFVAYRASQHTLLQSIASGNFALARSFANRIDEQFPAGISTGPERAAVMDQITRSWSTDAAIEGSYLCVVGPEGGLEVHTARPEMVGRDVRLMPVGSPDPPGTVMDLIDHRTNWAGESLDVQGEPQLVGYAYSTALDGLIAVHLPTRLIEGQVLAASRPWLLGLAVIVAILIPFALALLHESYRRAEAAGEEAMAALRESEERLKLALDGTDLGVWDWDIRSGTVYRSEQWAGMLGYSADEIEPTVGAWESRVHPDDRAQIADAVSAHFRGLAPMYETEHRIRAKSGEWKWVLDQGKVVHRDAWGEPVRATGTHRDIDARRRAELASEASRRDFEMLADSSPSLVFRLDAKGDCVYANGQWREMTGRPDRMWPRSGWMEAVHPDDRTQVESAVREGARTRRAWRCEHRFLRQGGDEVWTLTLATPCLGDAGNFEGFIGTCTDISELKRSEAALRVSREELQRRHEVERLLFSELDHRVRNNLSSLVALIDLTRRRSTHLDAFADTIRARALAMATVHGLLTSSRQLSTSFGDLVRALLPPGHEGQLSLRGDDIEVDARQATALAMVVHELITNSSKYGALGAQRGRLEVRCDVVRDAEDLAQVDLRWRETGGPIIETKPEPGVGTSLIEGLVRADLRGEVTLHYDEHGADHRFHLAIEGPAAAPAKAAPA